MYCASVVGSLPSGEIPEPILRRLFYNDWRWLGDGNALVCCIAGRALVNGGGMRSLRGFLLGWVCVAAGMVAYSAQAQQLIIGNGAQMQMGSAQLDLGCRDLEVLGTLSMESGTVRGVRDVRAVGPLTGGNGHLRLSGDLDAATALIAQSGTVEIEDGCGRTQSRIVGSHSFNRLFLHSVAGRLQLLPGAQTQSIAGSLDLEGGTDRLRLRSDTAGSVALLNLATNASQRVVRIDVEDVGAPPESQYLAPDLPASYDSIDRGNSPRFFSQNDQPVHPVPLMSPPAAAILLVLMAAICWYQLRSTRLGESRCD